MVNKISEFKAYDEKGNLLVSSEREIPIEDKVKISVYDKEGNFIGFKVDTFWTLHTESFKPGFMRGVKRYLTSLRTFLNRQDSKEFYRRNYPEKFKVVVEPLEEGKLEKITYRFFINENDDYRYRKK